MLICVREMMDRLRQKLVSRTIVTRPCGSLPPAWAEDLVGAAPPRAVAASLHVRESPEFALATFRAADASDIEGATFQAYRELGERLRIGRDWHAVRIWNLIPHILAPAGEGIDRYVRFNAGRFRALCDWFGGPERFDWSLPAASGVASPEPSLVIHALLARVPGVPVANPRQVPPHRYSARFGPLPPCFARAVVVQTKSEGRLLLVGGTASVRGEDSVHVGDLGAQLDETLQNLAALVGAAAGDSVQRAAPLDHFRELRLYHVREEDREPLAARVLRAFPRLRRLELVHADLCRRDLLVEIEGIAEL